MWSCRSLSFFIFAQSQIDSRFGPLSPHHDHDAPRARGTTALTSPVLCLFTTFYFHTQSIPCALDTSSFIVHVVVHQSSPHPSHVLQTLLP